MVQLTPTDLIELVIKAVDTFKAVQQVKTLDAHADDFLGSKRGLEEGDQVFVRQVLYGVNRYRKLLKVIVSSFYFKHSHEASLSDRTRYAIFGYLIMMRLDELGWPAFERLVMSQDQRAIFVFVNYVFSQHNLQNWMKPEWLKIYDEDYVDSGLIAGVLKWAESAGQMLTSMEERVYDVAPLDDDTGGAATTKEKQVTEVQPFNLTKPKPRMVPEPDFIPCGVKANPVNERILDPSYRPAVEGRIEKLLTANRAELEGKYPAELEFSFQTAGRIGAARPEGSQTYFPAAKKRVEEERAAALQFDMKHGAPLPKPPTKESAPIKLNTAAIYREDAMYRQKQEKEAAMIKRYESELRDGSEFEAWQRRMEEADEEERLKEINRRRIEMALSQEQAIEARKRKVRENLVAAHMQQAESSVLAEKHEAEKMEEYMQKKLLVDDVIESRAAVPEARQQMADAAVARAQQVRQESEELELQRQRMLAEEQARKQDLIRQIKAMENVPVEKVIKFDPTETAGHMLLEEMSLAELKERLALAGRRRAEEREARRGDILRARKEKEDDLAQRAERLSRIRSDASEQGTARRRDARRKERCADHPREWPALGSMHRPCGWVAAFLRRCAMSVGGAPLGVFFFFCLVFDPLGVCVCVCVCVCARDARLQQVAKSDAKALKLQAELEQKRAARKREDVRLAAELKEISLKKQFLDADFSKVEETKYKELEMVGATTDRTVSTATHSGFWWGGAWASGGGELSAERCGAVGGCTQGFEREIRARQAAKKHQQAVYEQTRQTEQGVRGAIVRNDAKVKADFRRDYDERVADGLAKSEQLKRNELAYTMSMVQLEHVRDRLSKGDQEVQSGYTTAISHRETMRGRRHAAETTRRLAQA
jgi:hypothetical protein